MSRPLPVSHKLVLAVARQLADAINADLYHGDAGTVRPDTVFGPRAMAVIAELVGATQGRTGETFQELP